MAPAPAPRSRMTATRAAWLAAVLCLACHVTFAHEVKLDVASSRIALGVGTQTWHFSHAGDGWALDTIEVSGTSVAKPRSRADGFFAGSGAASSFVVLTNDAQAKSLRFTVGTTSVSYTVDSRDRLPLVRVKVDGPATATCAFRTAGADAGEHGAWVTRGYVATDADGHEDFIDSSGPTVFGHSTAGGVDVAYLFMPKVKEHVQRNGRTEQRSETWFKSGRQETGGGQFFGFCQLRMGRGEPKEFAVLFDRDLGGRLSDVCEKYFAPAVDTLVEIASVPLGDFDPAKCLEVMPVRLASPDAFIPGWGWMMDEFPKASYPFAHDAVWQQPALLAFQGLATGRDYERNFARFLLDQTPLEGADGKSFFVRRPGGLTRWAYFATYRDGFPHLDGGTWWQADLLYRTALALDDAKLRRAALDMVLHDLNVKLDLEQMTYPPCWSAIQNAVGTDHRDDWFQTPGLAYCAYMAAKVAYPETDDREYLAIADRIGDWFAKSMTPELKLNFLQGNNLYAVFSHYVPLMFLDRYERTHDRRFLDLARDTAWVFILTTCTTAAKDWHGAPLTGTTCVGVRNCVDYDCAPNLCHEKDLTFVHLIGPLLDHVSGPGYAKYLALHRLTLAKDSWKSAWATDLRDTNLRTMYDTYARGMANLIFALDAGSDPRVAVVEKLVSKSDTNIVRQRDLVLVNGTTQPRTTRARIPSLRAGLYEVTGDGLNLGRKSDRELAEGFTVELPANSMKRIQVRAVSLDPEPALAARSYDTSTTYLSDFEPVAAQRGTGVPQPTYRKDRAFADRPLRLDGRAFAKGLGCAANTVLLYDLDGRFERFRAVLGVDDAVAGLTNPSPSVFFTVHVDGVLRFESGAMFTNTPPRAVDVDLRHARKLMLRMSCNWDDNGKSVNDHGDWAEARLVGKTPE
jgi:hypothetical protein